MPVSTIRRRVLRLSTLKSIESTLTLFATTTRWITLLSRATCRSTRMSLSLYLPTSTNIHCDIAHFLPNLLTSITTFDAGKTLFHVIHTTLLTNRESLSTRGISLWFRVRHSILVEFLNWSFGWPLTRELLSKLEWPPSPPPHLE